MPSFSNLPKEMRIEIFRQISRSRDAHSFRLSDRINFHLLTPWLFNKYKFMPLKDVHLLSNLFRHKHIREFALQVFYKAWEFLYYPEPYNGDSHAWYRNRQQKEDNYQNSLRYLHKSFERYRQKGLQVLKWAVHAKVSTKENSDYMRGVNGFISGNAHTFTELVEASDPALSEPQTLIDEWLETDCAVKCLTDSQVVYQYYKILYGKFGPLDSFRTSIIYLVARNKMNWDHGDMLGELNELRSLSSPHRPVPPKLTLQNGKLTPGKYREGILKKMRAKIVFVRNLKRLYMMCEKEPHVMPEF
ncbi:hypothetical protein BJ508DRAFT_305888 [Ascobolus immersus RN42]|uniref:Uncharacterized protein n=1 Tax=Ascobolus immersus RN42 TaxID=1160509 RepID=A0A3N4IDC2_ASCIM|nr:hypothetical protein BJ508DRAFT_305888 [Ascobolus immersus RN42]